MKDFWYCIPEIGKCAAIVAFLFGLAVANIQLFGMLLVFSLLTVFVWAVREIWRNLK